MRQHDARGRTRRAPPCLPRLPVAGGALLVLLLLPDGALAQTAGDADPGAIERRIEDLEPRRERRRPEPPDLPAAPAEPAPEDEISFTLAAVIVEGATVFDAIDLAPAYEDYLATTVTTAEAEAIAHAITDHYRAAGYALSRAYVPPQVVETGVLRVVVLEGRIDEVAFEGAEPPPADLAPYAAAIRAEAPLTLDTLERNILLIDDLAGITVEGSRLDEIGEATGVFRLTLDIGYTALDGYFYADNRGTPAVGRVQSWTSVAANSALGTGERIQLGLFTVPFQPEELIYTELGWTQPLGADGTEGALVLAHSTSDPGSDLGELDTESKTFRASLRLSHPIVRSRAENLWLNGIFDYRNAREDRRGVRHFDDRLRVARVRVNYVVADTGGATTSALARLSQGLDVLGASNEGAGPLSRADGRSAFTKLDVDVVHTRPLFDRWSVQLAAAGQKSARALLAAEEFGLGGARYGRAYDYFEIAGEDAVAGAAELRYALPDPGDVFTFVQLYGFYDAGAVWNRNATGEFRRHSLSSAGTGVRFDLPRSVSASVEVAKPLTRPVATSNNDNKPRYFFSLSAAF